MALATTDSGHPRVEGHDVLLTNTNRWAVAARLALGLSKVGFSVSALCPSGHPLLKTRVIKRAFNYSGIRPLQSLEVAIRATAPRVVIPCDDHAVLHLHELHLLASRGEIPDGLCAALIERSLGSPQSYPTVVSRYDLLAAAREEGLRVPETTVVTTIEDLEAWRVSHAFPWVLKADSTCSGQGVRITHSLEEAERGFASLTRLFGFVQAFKRLCLNGDSFWLRPAWNGYTPGIVVQRYVQGRPANCAVLCSEGKVLAGLAVEVLSAQSPTGPASVVRVVDNPQMMLCAERLARRLRLSGFFGLDFVLEEGTGASCLIEMNPRCTPLCHLQLGDGRDMIGALWAMLSGEAPPQRAAVTQNDVIAYFPDAWTYESEFLQSSFHDVPHEAPDLVAALLRPTFSRKFLARLTPSKTRSLG